MSRSLLSVVEGLDHVYERVVADPDVRDGDLMSWVGEALMALEPPVGMTQHMSSVVAFQTQSSDSRHAVQNCLIV